MALELFDTTMRDGEQSEGISFTVADKIKISHLLDDLGIHYLEGGWPGSNPKAVDFFDEVAKESFNQTTIVAFGSTRRPQFTPEEDPNLNTLLKSKVNVACIFGKAWDFHVTHALNVPLDQNLQMIEDSVRYLKQNLDKVFFDAEHFFDGFKKNPDYAISAIQAAERGGADVLVLADTNGGALPYDVERIMQIVKTKVNTPLGIHAHNDSELAVANSLMAVRNGAVQVQGTINGYGERSGNANLCSIIPSLKLKMGHDCISDENLAKLTGLSRHVSEIANLAHNSHYAYVGRSSFAHKGGIHVSAINKYPETYEHIRPELVGNQQRVLVSELSGISNLLYKAERMGIKLDKKDPVVKALLKEIKDMENAGYQFEEGEATFELMLRRATNQVQRFFKLLGFRVINDKQGDDIFIIEATVKLEIDGDVVHTAGEGNGPVSALYHAFQKALAGRYPVLNDIRLTDYKVRVLNSKEGENSMVRVIIETSDGKETWGTVGVSTNIVEASWNALIDSMEYKLIKEESL
jgi:2-isopropylmalate synthase